MELSRFQELYKSRSRFIPLSDRTSISRRISNTRERQSWRNSILMERRQIPNGVISPILTSSTTQNLNNNSKKKIEKEKVPVVKNDRKEKLLIWLQEKKKRLEKEKQKKRVFKVCHISHTEDLNTVYNEIKGQQISNKVKKPETIAPSNNYKFKPPKNVKPLQFKEPANNPSKKKLQMSEKKSDKSLQANSKQKTENRNVLDTKQSTSSKPSTSGIQQVSKTNKKGRTNIPSSSSDMEEDLQKRSVRQSTRSSKLTNKLKKVETDPPSSVTTKKTTVLRKTRAKGTSPQPSTSGIQQVHKTNINGRTKMGSSSSETDEDLQKSSVSMSTRTVTTGKSIFSRKLQTQATIPRKLCTTSCLQSVESSSSLSSDYPLSETNITTPNNERLVTYLSPFVTVSRGKTNARKEYQRKSEDSYTEDSRSPKAAAAYFYTLLNNQVTHLQEMCKEWETYKEKENPIEEACDMINVAIGQTELLMNKKFQQFRELIYMCETGDSEKPVKCLDLHGFWDMLSFQVSNIDNRFKNLQRLKNNDWEEILPEVKTHKANNILTKKATKKPPSMKSASSVRAFIQAQRKKTAKGDETANEDVCVVMNNKNADVIADDLRIALVSSARKRISSPGLRMMKITQAAKLVRKSSSAANTPTTMDRSVNNPRSILKSQRRSRSEIRKPKAVLFQDGPDSPEDQENDLNIFNVNLDTTQGQPTPRRSRRLAKRNCFL